MEGEGRSELAGETNAAAMLPPEPRTFDDREDLISYAREFGAAQGYVVTIKKSRRDRRLILGCDRGGVYRSRRKVEEANRKRKATSKLINCPFEAVGKRDDRVWTLTIKNGDHNHEPLKDISEHPCSRRFTDEEVRQIKVMTEAGAKPRQVLKALKQRNPELHSTPRHLYNLKAKFRSGNVSNKSLKSRSPSRSRPVDTSSVPPGMPRKKTVNLVPNFIGGKFLESHGRGFVDVINPATQEVVAQYRMTTYEELKAAVNAAKQAFPFWKNTSASFRQSILFKFHDLIRCSTDKFAAAITEEQGMPLKAAELDTVLGLEAVEQTCGVATLNAGNFVPNSSKLVDSICVREPIGVCAGICLSNFPATAPLWIFPIAVACGNTFVLKACEKNPGVSIMLGELAKEAGLPDGVLNIVHGTDDIINHICDDEDIKALSIISSSMAHSYISTKAVVQGKRVQANFGGKRYAIVMPDANLNSTLDALFPKGSSTVALQGMAANIAIFVGSSLPWERELVARAKALKVNEGTNPCADLGPVISREVKDRICLLVQMAVESGARLVLDGRTVMVPRYENGNFIGPTIICDVTTRMDCYKEEISGPVLLCMQVGSIEEAVTIVNRDKHAIGAALITSSGIAARNFQADIQTGLVGINTAPPFTLPFLSLNGSKSSLTVKECVEFYTQTKLIAQQWNNLTNLRSVPLIRSSSAEITLTEQGVSDLQSTSENESSRSRVSPATSDDRDSLRSPSPDRDYQPSWRIPATVSSQDGAVSLEHGSGELVNQITTTLHGTESDGIYIPYMPTIRNSNAAGSLMESFSTERVHMLSATPMNQITGPSFDRRTTEETVFPVPERSYGPSTSRSDDQSASLQSNPFDRICDNASLCSQSGVNGISSNSERMYLPSLIQRNPGILPSPSDSLHMPSTLQRLYPQNLVAPMDAFPGQVLKDGV